MKRYSMGLDFGSLSGRAVIAEIETGTIVAESSMDYPHAVMYTALPDGTALPPDSAVQHPQDYLDVLSFVARDAISRAGIQPEQVACVGVDFTAATLVPVDRDLNPLCRDPRFISRPKAYVTMWKDHTAAAQAKKIDEIEAIRNDPFFARIGGKCSSENGMAKLLCILQTDEEVYNAAYRILEAGDWITSLLCGTEKKSRNIASCKEFWCSDRGGYPSEEFFKACDPRFATVVEDKLGGDTVSSDAKFGEVTERGSELSGLAVGTTVATAFTDGSAAFPACGISGDGEMVLVIGTSLVHQVLGKDYTDVPGLISVCTDGVYGGYTVYEAGQSSCGDHLSWYLNNALPAAYAEESNRRGIGIHALLREKLNGTKPGQSGLICVDWFNGNRSIFNDSDLSATLIGLNLQTKPEEIYRALIEGTAFGTRRILDRLNEYRIPVRRLVACGGIARKDPMTMQIFADILNRPISVSCATQAPALSSAISATVALGAEHGGYASISEAVERMAKVDYDAYLPDSNANAVYEELYEQYLAAHDFFGKDADILHRLKGISRREKTENEV